MVARQRAFKDPPLSPCSWKIKSISFGMHTYEKSARNSFRMHTCGTKDLKSSGMNTYEKQGEGGVSRTSKNSTARTEPGAARLRPPAILFVELLVLVIRRSRPAVDEQEAHLSAEF